MKGSYLQKRNDTEKPSEGNSQSVPCSPTRWDDAIELNPASKELHDMKSQALMEIGEIFAAVVEADKAVRIDPNWAFVIQTLITIITNDRAIKHWEELN